MDEIVSTVYFEGEVYIFTKYGQVWKMIKEAQSGNVQFQRVADLRFA